MHTIPSIPEKTIVFREDKVEQEIVRQTKHMNVFKLVRQSQLSLPHEEIRCGTQAIKLK
jgi:hypothetical protein